MNKKAIALLSGGLDSILAIKLVLAQGIETEALHFSVPFYTSFSQEKNFLAVKAHAEKLKISLKIQKAGKDYLEVIKHPKYGYGKNFNSCLDCRIFMFRKAASYMRERGASFIVSGEVLGQRPMSQTKAAMCLIEKEAGAKGMILRPLSARLLEPTIAERQGVIEREKLMQIEGRSRRVQRQMAKDFGIEDYPQPAGGCLLTDPGFSRRIKDLMKYNSGFGIKDIEILKVGRHFRLAPGAKLAVGRNEAENKEILNLIQRKDFLFEPKNIKGPQAIGRGIFNKKDLILAAGIVARYSDCDLGEKVEVSVKGKSTDTSFFVSPIKESLLDELRI